MAVSTKNSKRALMWLGLAVVILLVFLSIYGAFVGAERAKNFFNSLPLSVYWCGFAVVLAVGIVMFRRLTEVPSLLLIHAGCIFVLAGSIWGSAAGHRIQRQLLGIDKIAQGRMIIYQGYSDNRVFLKDSKKFKELPFTIKLLDFRIEYYQPGELLVESQDEKTWTIPIEIDSEVNLGRQYGTIKILRKFENFKITFEGDRKIVTDQPGAGFNPALQVRIQYHDGKVVNRYVFERSDGHIYPGDTLTFRYQRTVSDYISRLQVIRQNKVVAQKSIEVNHPLHFAGYHFYQASYGNDGGWYTILEVVSDSGLYVVYAGYLMLCVGVCWHLWLRKLWFGKQS